MTLKTTILDGKGKGAEACVTPRNQLVVAPLDFSIAYNAEASTNNVAVNFVPPLPNKRFVITDILLYANKGVGASDATVAVYEATSATSTTIITSIMALEMLKQTARDLTGLNLLVSEGKWVNLKTDDNTIFGTIMGYYVDA